MTPTGAFWLAACSIAAGYAACELTHRLRRASRVIDRAPRPNADAEALEPWDVVDFGGAYVVLHTASDMAADEYIAARPEPVASCCVTQEWCGHRSPFGPMQVAADESTLRRWVDEGRES